jgi:hypothetical protein
MPLLSVGELCRLTLHAVRYTDVCGSRAQSGVCGNVAKVHGVSARRIFGASMIVECLGQPDKQTKV